MADEIPEPKPKDIRIEYGEAERLSAQYATHMTVQVTPVEFILSFYQVFPPLFSGPETEQREQMAKTDKVEARCVARVAVAAPRIPEFIRVLGEQAKRHEEGLRAAVQAQEKPKQ